MFTFVTVALKVLFLKQSLDLCNSLRIAQLLSNGIHVEYSLNFAYSRMNYMALSVITESMYKRQPRRKTNLYEYASCFICYLRSLTSAECRMVFEV